MNHRYLKWLVASAALIASANAAAVERIYGLVIGIDDYAAVTPLKGAVNDAKLLSSTLRDIGAAEVRTLIDRQVTRDAFVAAFKDLANKASATGGWLVITYSGHGAQEPERLAGDEQDGRDEILVLPTFQASADRSAERIPDNEIYELLRSVPANVRVLFVADACHSGTLTRGADKRASALTYRNVEYGAISDDALPPPPPTSRGRDATDLPGVVFVASALDSEKTPELMIDGRPHGAVSWYLAKALRGAADSNSDGRTTLAELRGFLAVAPRVLAEGLQTPSVHYLAGRDSEVFTLSQRASPTPLRAPTLKVWTLGGSLPTGLTLATQASSKAEADLIWDMGRSEIVNNRTGDLVAQKSAAQDQLRFGAGVIDKWTALPRLKEAVAARPMVVEIGPRGTGARYAQEPVSIRLAPRAGASRYLTILNIASDGTVQLLYPGRDPREAGPQPSANGISFENEVTPPYGADHVVAIASGEEPVALRALLRSVEGQQAAGQVAAAVAEASARGDLVGMAGLYTGTDR